MTREGKEISDTSQMVQQFQQMHLLEEISPMVHTLKIVLQHFQKKCEEREFQNGGIDILSGGIDPVVIENW